MPYKDKEKRQKASKLSMQKRRGLTLGVNNEGLTDEGLTHPIMKYLVPGEDRTKMELIVKSLSNHGVLDKVYYGCSKYSLPMDVVGEMLEVTG